MITTKANLRVTATEAYDKGWAEGAASRNRADDAMARSRGRREGEQAVLAYILERLRIEEAALGEEIGWAQTRWEKRLLVGRLKGIRAAIETAKSA